MGISGWVSIESAQPHKGQIVEVLSIKPAIYDEKNVYGCHLWQSFNEYERIVFWRLPENLSTVYYVQHKLSQRFTDENNK